MKRIIAISTLIALSLSCYPQAYQKGNIIVSPGITLSNYGYYNGLNNGISSTLHADYAIRQFISVGAFGGYSIRNSRLSDAQFKSIIVGARGSIHWFRLITKFLGKDSQKIDLYASIYLGYEMTNYSSIYTESTLNDKRIRSGVLLGIRYYPISKFDKLGVFGEIGNTPFGAINAGLCVRI